MEDEEFLLSSLLVRRESEASYATGVCTSSLVLEAAGLLRGYRAATRWLFMDLLGTEPALQRVVKDRNRITSGGITAGTDFGLAVAAEIAGEDAAKEIQPMMEYDPVPPFGFEAPGAPSEISWNGSRRRANRCRRSGPRWRGERGPGWGCEPPRSLERVR